MKRLKSGLWICLCLCATSLVGQTKVKTTAEKVMLFHSTENVESKGTRHQRENRRTYPEARATECRVGTTQWQTFNSYERDCRKRKRAHCLQSHIYAELLREKCRLVPTHAPSL
ncbi:hypothetical protein [uncultured Bacteroides sp.]|uniref:hypothetical protein n=1 Tax=uncultured Bacteroides sp. TaxID=162156 RepID=UPI0025E0D3D5|nr:hypothetical protein [uncultured Bacteroides sp.]